MRAFLMALVIAVATACMPLSGASRADSPGGTILAVSGGDTLAEDALFDRLRSADVVIIGEIHDNPLHHLAQARIVGALDPSGVAFEMIPRASEEGIAVFLEQGGAPGEIGPAIGWDRLGWPDWEIYRPVFEAADDAAITGGALPRAEVRRAVSEGAAWVLGEGAFQPVLAKPLPDTVQRQMEEEMVAAHCGHLPASVAPGMVEAQRLRDASFAAAVLRARQIAPGMAVLITGNGHARKSVGVPVYLNAVAPELEVLVVGLAEDTPEDLSNEPYDFVWVTEPHAREDPCARFNK